MTRKPLGLLCLILSAFVASAADGPALRVDAARVGPRQLEKVTETSVVRDYLQAWQSLDQAMSENDAELLNRDFQGVAREKLAGVIAQQQKLGIKSSYRDRAHNVRIVFYSPEGLSIQLLDTVEYDMQITDGKQEQPVEHVRATYVAVLTPAEASWKVRILQSLPADESKP